MIHSEKFKQDVLVLARDVGVEPKEIHIRKMKRKWASCSSRGRLTFEPKLLEESIEIRNKAILHELLHLKYPNHGRMFNTLLNTYLQRSIRNNGVNMNRNSKNHQTSNKNEERARAQ